MSFDAIMCVLIPICVALLLLSAITWLLILSKFDELWERLHGLEKRLKKDADKN